MIKIMPDNSTTQVAIFRGKMTPNDIKKVINSSSGETIGKLAAVTAGAVGILTLKNESIKLNPEDVQKDLDAGYSLGDLAEKYNTKVSRIRTFMDLNGLVTNDGKILRTIKKEDLEKYVQEGKSSKEIAEIYGLKYSGSLTPLFKVFGIGKPTDKKVKSITKEQLLEFKKDGFSDYEISQKLSISPQYLSHRRRELGLTEQEAKAARKYPTENILRMVSEGYEASQISEKLRVPLRTVRAIVKENGYMFIPKSGAQAFRYKKGEVRKVIKENITDFPNQLYWASVVTLPYKLTEKNIDFYSKIVATPKLRDAEWPSELISLNRKEKKNPEIWQQATRMLDVITEDNKLDIPYKYDLPVIVCGIESKEDADRKIEMYNVVTNNPKLSKYAVLTGFREMLTRGRTVEQLEKIVNDEHLAKYAKKLLFADVEDKKGYDKTLEILSQKPDLLKQNEFLLRIFDFAQNHNDNALFATFLNNVLLADDSKVRDVMLKYMSHKGWNDYKQTNGIHSPNTQVFFKTTMRHPELLKNENFISNFDKIMHTMTTRNATARTNALEKILSTDELYNNSEIMNNLGDVILRIRNMAQFEEL